MLHQYLLAICWFYPYPPLYKYTCIYIYGYIFTLWLAWAFVPWYAWSHERRTSNRNGAHSIVQSSDNSRDSIALSYHTGVHCTTVARYTCIARFNAFASHNGRFRSCEFRTNTYEYFFINDYFCNSLRSKSNCSVARIFCRFWSCAICERAFRSKHVLY